MLIKCANAILRYEAPYVYISLDRSIEFLESTPIKNARNIRIRLHNPPFLPQKDQAFQLSLMGTYIAYDD
jgi:hypothetical protein